MSLCAGHQPNFWPYGGFFAKIASVDKFIIVDNVQYVKKEYHNRNRIQLINGKTCWLTAPVLSSGKFTQLIKDAVFDNSVSWQKQHLKTLSLNYCKSAYFDFLYPELQRIYNRPWSYLLDFNLEVISSCCSLLKIDTPISLASEIGAEGKSTELIALLCEQSSCTSYLHGMHAMDYVDFELLEKREITSYLQRFESKAYPQKSKEFVPNLSIVDILFNCGEKSLNLLKQSQTLNLFSPEIS